MSDDEKPMVDLLSTDDAMVWAEEWCQVATRLRRNDVEIIDVGWMVGWMANAMGVGESFGRQRLFTGEELQALVDITKAMAESSLREFYPGVNPDELLIKLKNLNPNRYYG